MVRKKNGSMMDMSSIILTNIKIRKAGGLREVFITQAFFYYFLHETINFSHSIFSPLKINLNFSTAIKSKSKPLLKMFIGTHQIRTYTKLHK